MMIKRRIVKYILAMAEHYRRESERDLDRAESERTAVDRQVCIAEASKDETFADELTCMANTFRKW